jgi:hypothetical protein
MGWHRQPVEWIAWRTWVFALCVAIAGTWLWRARAADAGQALLLRVVVVGAAFGLVFACPHSRCTTIAALRLSAMPRAS